jgi:AraC family transcriptional regulator
MEPTITTLPAKKLVGKRVSMSFASNTTTDLWRYFMPRKKEIVTMAGSVLYSLEVYPPGFFDHFDSTALFEKWAAVEVTDWNSIPPDLEAIEIPAGLYAVFVYKGPASRGQDTYQYIFAEWLPKSAYEVDTRPHAAVMGEKYKYEDPNSEEELWIPLKPKQNSNEISA